jgi:hypothetical protein
MASRMGVPTRFVTQPGFPWALEFEGLKAGSAAFTAVWKRIASRTPEAFQAAQHEFIKRTHYDVLRAKVLAERGLDVETRSRALQNVIWSTAVQHGGKTAIVSRAIAPFAPLVTNSDEQLIKAIYAERGRTKADGRLVYFSKNSASVQQGVARRFRDELKDALAMLRSETAAAAAPVAPNAVGEVVSQPESDSGENGPGLPEGFVVDQSERPLHQDPSATAIAPITPSLTSRVSAIWMQVTGAVAAVGLTTKELLSGGANFVQDHMAVALFFLGAVALVALGIWHYNRSRQRAHEKTLEVMRIAADQTRNNVRLV